MSTLDRRAETLRRKLGLIPNLLVVDGDAAARAEIADLAHAEGFLVHQASDAGIAMRLLGVGGISVLATDLQLNSATDGVELLKEAHAKWPLLPLIAMSQNLAPFPGLLPPGTRFAGKPFRLRRLARQLRAAALQGVHAS